MKRRDLADLLLLAALWGSSFLFMRMAVPAFGPVAMAFVRVAGATLFLLPILAWRGEGPALRQHWRALLVLGLGNSALPFLLFGYAVYTLPAGLAAIFNAATPLWAALVAWAWLGAPLTRWRSAGLALGLLGVVGLGLYKSMAGGALQGLRLDPPTALAVAACMLATLLYGASASHARRYLADVPPMAIATGSQLAAAVVLLLPALWAWPASPPGLPAWGQAAALAVLASGVGYILYFRLISSAGPTAAASVTFLVPVFASGWGALVLGEVVTGAMLLGGAVVLAGSALVLGLLPRPRRPAQT